MPLMSFPEGSSPQGVDQPVWAAAENGAFRDFNSTVTQTWREWYGTLSINGGPVQEFDQGKVIGSDEYSFAQSIPDSSVTTPAGAADVGSMGDGMAVGKQGNPFKAVEDAAKAVSKQLDANQRALVELAKQAERLG